MVWNQVECLELNKKDEEITKERKRGGRGELLLSMISGRYTGLAHTHSRAVLASLVKFGPGSQLVMSPFGSFKRGNVVQAHK
jgi:hypothetical protein